jgi:hypothetical protein
VNAYQELSAFLEADEQVEALVFGNWGWDSGDDEPGYGEPSPPPVPFDMRRKVLTLEQAEPLMQSWRFRGGYGAPECYAVTVWTNRRVIWVTQYDGSTRLSAALRNPEPCNPYMPGGG